MSEEAHNATRGVFNRWYKAMKQKLGGTLDWTKIADRQMRALSEDMFDAAEVPDEIRQQYWSEFKKYTETLK